MKIFYAVQATGNGHISRAMTLIPYLEKYGQVDIFLSGNNSHLPLHGPIKYRSQGISLYFDKKGGLNYRKTASNFHFLQLTRDIRNLPVEKYDLVLNDFDLLTSLACRRKRVPFVHFGHQASFISEVVPRPEKKIGYAEWLLKNYARSPYTTGLHFEKYAPYIFEPIIKQEILEAQPIDKGHITVYLPSYSLPFLIQLFSTIPQQKFEIFTQEKKRSEFWGNCHIHPVSKEGFNKSFINCHGIICGAGFETPAEALHMGKKIIAVPIRKQYEQECNAAALATMNITVFPFLSQYHGSQIEDWLSSTSTPVKRDYSHSTDQALAHVFGHLSHFPSRLPQFSLPVA